MFINEDDKNRILARAEGKLLDIVAERTTLHKSGKITKAVARSAAMNAD
jgi:hypothetical protein